MLELLPAVLGAAAIFVAVYALATPASRGRMQARLERIGRGDILTEREEELRRPFAERVLGPGVRWFATSVRGLLPSSLADDIELRLQRAGEPMSLHAFVLMQAVAATVAVLIVLMGLASGIDRLMVLGFGVAGLGIAAGPLVWLDNAQSSRRKELLRALPNAADLIVTMVEAGMSIDAALMKVSEDTEGPLADELRFTMQETTLGRSRKDALLALVDRTQVPELRTFVQAIIHAQATGVPLGKVLRTQANEIRLKKRQRAEEAAHKAPVKVLVVMIFFVMPALLLMLLGPAAIRAADLL